MESLLDFANNNPEIAQQFLKGVTSAKKDETDETVFN